MEYGARTQSAVKPLDGVETIAEGKSMVFGVGDVKGEEAVEVAKGGGKLCY